MKKKTMRKKVLVVFLMCCMIFGLVACGGSGNKGGSSNSEGNGDGSSSAEEIPEKPDYTITISVAVSITGDAFTTMSEAADAFNATQSDYKVDLYYAGGYNDILTVVQTSSPSDIPDIYMLSGNGSALALQDEKYYVPVQKFMDEDEFDSSNIVEFLATNYTKDGEWQVLPWGSSNVGQYWNEDILASVGLKVEDMDSYEDILAACDKLAAKGYKNFYGMYQMQHNDWLNFALASEGIDYCDNDNARGGCPTKYLYMEDEICHDAALTYFEFVREMINRGYAADRQLSLNDLYNAFAAGDVIVVDANASRSTTVMNTVKGAFTVRYQVSPTIYASTESKGQAPGGNCFFIGNSGNYWSERGAWEFLKYLYTNDEIVVQYAMDTGYSPVTYSATNVETYQTYMKEVFPDAQRTIDAQWNTPIGIGYAPSPVQSEVLSAFSTVVYDMWTDHSYTAQKALSDFTDKCNDALELYRITNRLN